MKKVLRLLAITFLIALVVGLITLLIGLILRWNTPTQFSNGFFWAGSILVVLGLLSILGGFGLRGNFGVVYSQSAGDMSLLERSQRWVKDSLQGYNALLLLLLSGAYLFLASILTANLF